jgi:hypothetical protein
MSCTRVFQCLDGDPDRAKPRPRGSTNPRHRHPFGAAQPRIAHRPRVQVARCRLWRFHASSVQTRCGRRGTRETAIGAVA